jgi:hypothetical protein
MLDCRSFCPKDVVTVLSLSKPHIKLVLGALSLRVKWPGCYEVDPYTASDAEVMNKWNLPALHLTPS